MQKQLTRHAQVAALIRAELKKHGVAGTVRSRTASMMTAVDVKLENPTPWTRKAVEMFCAQYRAGHFDGMTDCYEYTNRRADGLTVKYLSVTAEFDEAHHERAIVYLAKYGFERDTVWQVLSGAHDQSIAHLREISKFWQKPRIQAWALAYAERQRAQAEPAAPTPLPRANIVYLPTARVQ